MSNTDYPAKIHVLNMWLKGDFSDSVLVWHNFLEIINKLSDVTVLASLKHDFPGGGLSGVVIIGESHAAIHTWPEEDKAWVEIATCGDPAALKEFEDHYKSAKLH